MTGHLFDPPSDKDHVFTPAPAGPMPASVSYESVIGPAHDQGQTKRCVGYACWALLNFLAVWRGHAQAFDSPEGIYAKCKAIDGIPGDATYVRVGMDVLRRDFGIGETVRLASAGDIKVALATERPVVMGVQVDYQNLRAFVPTNCVLANVDGFDGGHAMAVVGYDDARDAFRLRSSYGLKWADSGHCWMQASYLDAAQFDAWTVAQ